MSITRAKVSGWSTGEEVTHTQLNNVDLNATYALDKRSGQSDTLASAVSVTGSVTAGSGGSLAVGSGGAFNVQSGGSVAVASGGAVTMASGSSLTINGATCSIAMGAGCSVALISAATLSLTGAGTNLTLNSGAQLRSNAAGSIVLAGGSSDYPAFSATRSLTKRFGFNIQASQDKSLGWKYNGGYTAPRLISTAVSDVGHFEIPIHDGATLSSVTVYYSIATSHFPANKLSFAVRRNPGNGSAESSLVVAGSTAVAGANAAAYFNSGTVTALTITCDQNNVMDRANFGSYYIVATEENGSSSVAGNYIYGFEATYTNISNMRFA